MFNFTENMMQNLEIILDKVLTVLPKEPAIFVAILGMFLAGFALYVVLSVVKTLSKQGER
jgi:hypothetical protein